MINGELIKKKRIEKGLTQPELAKLCGYQNRASICMLEKGDIEDLPLSKAIVLAKVLGIKPTELTK